MKIKLLFLALLFCLSTVCVQATELLCEFDRGDKIKQRLYLDEENSTVTVKFASGDEHKLNALYTPETIIYVRKIVAKEGDVMTFKEEVDRKDLDIESTFWLQRKRPDGSLRIEVDVDQDGECKLVNE